MDLENPYTQKKKNRHPAVPKDLHHELWGSDLISSDLPHVQNNLTGTLDGPADLGRGDVDFRRLLARERHEKRHTRDGGVQDRKKKGQAAEK